MHRRILYLSFSFVFLVLAPLLVLFAKGYRTDFRHRQVFRTGLVFFTVRPRPDVVLIDSRPYSSPTSPVRITGVVPGEHQLTIQREGYYTWTRMITVQPGTTTNLEAIQLFRDQTAKRVLSGVTALRLAPNGHTVAALQSDRITILSTDGNQLASFIMPGETVPKDVVWSPNNTAAIITTEAGAGYLYQEHQSSLTSLPSFPFADKILWDQRQPQTMYILGKYALYAYDILSHSSSLLLSAVVDFTQAGDSLIVLQPDPAGLLLRERLRDGRIETWTTLAENRLQFLFSPDGYVTLLAKEQNQLLLLRASGTPRQALTLSDVTYASWNRDGSRLAYGNDFELFVLELSSEGTQTKLLNRTSGGFRNVWWLEPFPALLVQREKAIIVFDSITKATGDFLSFLSFDVRDAQIDADDQRAVFLLTDKNVFFKPF